MLGGAPEEMTAPDYLAAQRVRIALQGHAPFAAATQAVYETLKALREGTSPKNLKGLASSELAGRVMREVEVKARSNEFLGLKKMSVAIRHVTMRGRVQGVGYRAWVEHQATAHGLEGWVRNRRDGSVEAVFAGPEDVVSKMIASCRRGPSSARVDGVEDEAGNQDKLNLRRAGERFSVLGTI